VKTKECRLRDVKEKDHISVAKASGYRGFSVYLDVRVSMLDFVGSVPFELQLRTELQDTWAEREHPLIYKNKRLKIAPMVAKQRIRDKVHKLSDLLYDVDCKFDEIREEVLKVIANNKKL